MAASMTLRNRVRIVTAAALFDGHDAAINIMRRLMQRAGAEVVHLGHNRSAKEIVDAAVMEDAQAVAITSYQGGHREFFRYVIDLLKERDASHVRVFGGGGGVIVADEITELEAYGVTKIYSPEDGRRMGLMGMIEHLLEASDFETPRLPIRNGRLRDADLRRLASLLTQAEAGALDLPEPASKAPVVGLTGPGGAGKSVLTDELLRRFLLEFPDKRAAVLSVDPSRRRGGGALLGDRIRMNSIDPERVFMRSFATRGGADLRATVGGALEVCRAADYDLIFVETSGIGQADTGITDVSDLSLYVMTPEYGAPSQLEKIDMLDFADLVAVNKSDRRGAGDALRDVRKQIRRNREIPRGVPDEELPVFGTIASRFNDLGVNRLFTRLLGLADERMGTRFLQERTTELPLAVHDFVIVPPDREHYLGEIAQCVRDHRTRAERKAEAARELYRLEGAARALGDHAPAELHDRVEEARAALGRDGLAALSGWDDLVATYRGEELVTRIRDKEVRHPLFSESLSGTKIPKVALPRYHDWGDRLGWLLLENVPGAFPFTAGVFPLRRTDEEPKRMFAGEGPPERTNQRFHYLCQGEDAHRLSVAFDSVTLYGEDPDERPDIYGKIGESGVSICTLDDMKTLFGGFDLAAPNTSVSMTINGPAPAILAMYLNAAIDQQVERFTENQGRAPSAAERDDLRERTLRQVRGTVQADILKEDQAQNTCIFGTEFSLKMMGDIQEYFVAHEVRNYYSVSVSGYHIAEAGANPITQLALTLANGLTYVEYYLSRGMKVDAFARNLSFFFSNGLDPEYAVIGRVARRLWSVVLRDRYGAGERSQKLKYHIQTSGRSLHAQEVAFNDIRTTLQALLALNDNCNSLHTNAYDEAVTTPTEESVRRAMAIQLILNREFGLAKNENPLQGSFFLEELTDLVEEAVLREFRRLDERGGVLGAMERGYQRSRIQEESLFYEEKKNSGELPITGVNYFVDPEPEEEGAGVAELTRATKEEKDSQLKKLRAFQARHAADAPAALERLSAVALDGGNIFAELMHTVRVASLGQITRTLYAVGGQYRRSM